MFILLLFVFLLFFPNLIIMNFINIHEISSELHQHLLNVLIIAGITFIFDGIVWVEIGILEAGGDMNYMMMTIAVCFAIFMAIPIFYLIDISSLSVEMMWILYTLTDVACVLLLLHRYKSNKWIKIKV